MRWALALWGACVWAQQVGPGPAAWQYEGLLGLQASQTALSNWRAGGQNQLALGAQGRSKTTWSRRRLTLSLELSGQYGVLRVVPQRTYRKTQDFLLGVFQYERNVDTAGRWATSILVDGRTQWAPTYKYIGDSVVKPAQSAFLAPLYGQFSLGVRYRPLPKWTLTLSPLSGRLTYVRLQYLADAGAFGVLPAERDTAGAVVRPARRALWEVGVRLTSRLTAKPLKGLEINHFGDVFYSYSSKPRGPTVVSQLQAAYKLSTWLAVAFTQQAIYDPRTGAGKEALQLLTTWSLGVTWNITSPKSEAPSR